MRLIKLFLISVFVFAVLLFLLSLLLPTKAIVERAGVIDAPMPVVYAHIGDLRSWPQWNPWAAPELTGGQPTYTAITTGVGGRYTWTSMQNDRRITGTVTIQSVEPGHAIHYLMDVNGLRPVIGTIELKPATDGKGTAIHWRLETNMGWLPWWKLRGFLADRLTGPALEDGLTKLKTLAENDK